jgi:hypothetical protein
MDNKSLTIVLLIVFILMGIILMVYIVYYLSSNSSQCMKNPFIYGAKKIGDIECSCMKTGKTVTDTLFIKFNGTEMNTGSNGYLLP